MHFVGKCCCVGAVPGCSSRGSASSGITRVGVAWGEESQRHSQDPLTYHQAYHPECLVVMLLVNHHSHVSLDVKATVVTNNEHN